MSVWLLSLWLVLLGLCGDVGGDTGFKRSFERCPLIGFGNQTSKSKQIVLADLHYERLGNHVKCSQNAMAHAFYCRTRFSAPPVWVKQVPTQFDFSSLPPSPPLHLSSSAPNCTLMSSHVRESCKTYFFKWSTKNFEGTFFSHSPSSSHHPPPSLPSSSSSSSSSSLSLSPPSASPLEPSHPLSVFWRCYAEYFGFDQEEMCAPNDNTLLIHIRNGDVYIPLSRSAHAPHKYGQQSAPSLLGAILFKRWDEVVIISESAPRAPKSGPTLNFLYSIRKLLPFPILFAGGTFKEDLSRWLCAKNVVLAHTTLNNLLNLKASANVFLPDQYECPVNVRPFQYYKASNMIEWMGNWTNSEENQLKLLLTPFGGYSPCPFPTTVLPPSPPSLISRNHNKHYPPLLPIDLPPLYRSNLSSPLFHRPLHHTSYEGREGCSGDISEGDLVIDLRNNEPFPFCSLFAILMERPWKSVYFLIRESHLLPPLSSQYFSSCSSSWAYPEVSSACGENHASCPQSTCENYSSFSFFGLILHMVNAIRELLPFKNNIYVVSEIKFQQAIHSCASHIASPLGFKDFFLFFRLETEMKKREKEKEREEEREGGKEGEGEIEKGKEREGEKEREEERKKDPPKGVFWKSMKDFMEGRKREREREERDGGEREQEEVLERERAVVLYDLSGADDEEPLEIKRGKNILEKKIIADDVNQDEKSAVKFLNIPCHSKFGIIVEDEEPSPYKKQDEENEEKKKMSK